MDPAKPPPERGLWRELLQLAGASGTVHHVAWILYGRMDALGRATVLARTIAADGGLGLRTVKRSLAELRRIGVAR